MTAHADRKLSVAQLAEVRVRDVRARADDRRYSARIAKRDGERERACIDWAWAQKDRHDLLGHIDALDLDIAMLRSRDGHLSICSGAGDPFTCSVCSRPNRGAARIAELEAVLREASGWFGGGLNTDRTGDQIRRRMRAALEPKP